MKKIIYPLFLGALFTMGVQAQNYTDALRYSTEELNGSARFKGMSGAFGALGGDLSAININPAGSAVFTSSELTFSIGDNRNRKNVLFLGSNTDAKESDFDLNHFGVVFVIPNVSETWKKVSFGFNYQQTKNFNTSSLIYFGQNNVGLDDYFLHYAKKGNTGGTPFNYGLFAPEFFNNVGQNLRHIGEHYLDMGNISKNAQTAYLGIITRVIDPVDEKNMNETNYVTAGGGAIRTQKYEVLQKGQMNKYNFNFASQFGNNIYLGLNLNAHPVNNSTLYSLRENAFGGTSSATYINHQMQVNTTGNGFSFQLGGIVKVTNELRAGISYQSPTWFTLEEQTKEALYASVFNQDRDVDLINKYGDDIWYERSYKFRTPSAWTGSIAYVFGKRGIISLDYIYKGYDNIYFRTDYLKGENDIIQNNLTNTSSIRIGGEYRIKALSLRAGMRYEQSPYKNTKYVGDLNGYSLGVGYSFGGLRLDVSYDIAKQENLYQAYEAVLTTPAKISSTQSSLLFSLSAKLF